MFFLYNVYMHCAASCMHFEKRLMTFSIPAEGFKEKGMEFLEGMCRFAEFVTGALFVFLLFPYGI